MTVVTDVLTTEQIAAAYQIGMRRQAAKRRRGSQHRFGWEPTADEAQDTDGQSAVSECFVAKLHSLEWTSQSTTERDQDGTDVGGFVSVRWTPRPNGKLIVHEDEPDDLVATLCVLPIPQMRFVGGIDVHRAKQQQWWRDDVRYPAYFVPQHALR